MNAKWRKKLKKSALVYTAAALVTLSLLTALHSARLDEFRTAARSSCELSFEQTAAAVGALSETLEKSRYATGELCRVLASEAYAEACAAKAALATLPFSTVEMEQTKSFLGTAGAFVRGLCEKSGEFSDEVRADILALSDSASAYSALLLEMRDALHDGELEMDSREHRLENVLPRERAKLLSAAFAEAEAGFPSPGELRSRPAQEERPQAQYADSAAARAAAAKLLGVSEDLLREEYRYVDGSAAFSRGTLLVRADAGRVLELNDSRLVSAGEVSDKRAAEKAREFLAAAGCGDMAESGRERRGNVLFVRFDAKIGDALCPDCSAEVGVALDNCAVVSFRAPQALPEGDPEWPLDAASAQAALPDALTVLGTRKLVSGGQPCYEFRCADGERSVRILVDARYGRELGIEVEKP